VKIVSSDLDLVNAKMLLTLLLHHLLADFLRETLEEIFDSLGLSLANGGSGLCRFGFVGRKHGGDEVGCVAVLGSVATADTDDPEVGVFVKGDGDLCMRMVRTALEETLSSETYHGTERSTQQ